MPTVETVEHIVGFQFHFTCLTSERKKKVKRIFMSLFSMFTWCMAFVVVVVAKTKFCS